MPRPWSGFCAWSGSCALEPEAPAITPRAGVGARRAAALTLLVLMVGEVALVAALVDDLDGHGWIGPLLCALLVVGAVVVLRAAARRAGDDPSAARALVVLGAGIAFVALAATALLLAVFSIGV